MYLHKKFVQFFYQGRELGGRSDDAWRPLNVKGNDMANTGKLKELILYLARESEGDDFFGVVKLNKLLFYIDFDAYRQFGESVTGQEYQALSRGPAPRAVVPALEEMQIQGDLFIREEPLGAFTQKRPIAKRSVNVYLFNQNELALIAHTLRRFWGMSASRISELSHEFVGWALAEQGEKIPYGVALLGRDELTDQELEHAKIVEERARKWHATRGV